VLDPPERIFTKRYAVRCSHPDQSTVPLHVILKCHTARLNNESNQEIVLPFDVCKYRANVRVLNFFPDKVEDFAVGRRATEYDMLSDYSGGEDTDVEADRRMFKNGKGFAKKYEWRFALEVEDADPTSKKERMWLLVDNHSAQALLNMDATK
jgi:protection-of-telomeres protein 1